VSVWQHFDVPEAGYVNLFSEAISAAEKTNNDFFVPVDQDTQVIASDYSGQHRNATNELYSFVITTRSDLESWLPLRNEFREQWLPDGRRLYFKQLREPLRRRSYPYFLELCGALRANVLTVMIDNRVGSLIAGGPEALSNVLDDCFPAGIKPGNIEKMYRLAMCIAMIQAGLRREDQFSLWISDHDETLDTHEKREGFSRLATYFTFGLTRRKNSADQLFMTTEHEELPDWGEDLTSISDIAAGACAKLSGELPIFLNQTSWSTGISIKEEADWRAKIFADWLMRSQKRMRHVLLRLAPDANGNVRASAQQFVNWEKVTELSPDHPAPR